MADAGALPPAAEAEGAPNGQPEQQSTFKMLMGTVGRMMFFWMIMNWFKGGGQNQTANHQAAAPGSPAAKPSTNLFKPAIVYDMSAYLIETNKVDFEVHEPVWELKELTFGLWNEGETQDSIFYKELELDLNAEYEQLRNNGSLFLVSYIYPSKTSPNPKAENYGKNFVTSTSKSMTKIRKKKYQETVNLLSGGTERQEDKEKSGTTEWLPHWHGNLTISPVYDHTAWPQGKIPAPLDRYIRFNNNGNYYPVLYLNDWWNLQEDYKPINKTDETLKVHLCFQPLSLFKFQLYLSQSYNAEMFSMIQDAEEAEGDKDAMKKMILETQPWLLALTVAVSISHTVFEMLAFKNDIQFWKSRENIQGLSIRAVLFNCFCQLIVLLYVCDNDTNFMVKVSIGVGLLIELWKVTKCIIVERAAPGESNFMGFKFKENRSSGDSETSEYDKLAFKYLGMVCFPLAACYMVYSLYYNEHRGWYSFVLQSAYGFLLTFGFIAMTPQLFINYKLKSTAHLPWRMMTYKALNTFIDDLFAFVIQMPTLYRIGCLRDDVIFLIYLYQKWIYPTDMSRRNEFGITGEQASGDAKPEEIKEEKKAAIENKEESSQPEKTVEEKKDD